MFKSELTPERLFSEYGEWYRYFKNGINKMNNQELRFGEYLVATYYDGDFRKDLPQIFNEPDAHRAYEKTMVLLDPDFELSQ